MDSSDTRSNKPSSTRRRRAERPAKHAGHLTPRDLDLMTFVGQCRVASTDALAATFFTDRSTALRRLGRLLGSGLLRVLVEDLNASNLYGLTDRALELLVDEGVEEESLHTGRFPKREALGHLRFLSELRAAFVVALRARSDLTLDLFLSDHDLRRMAGAHPPSYIPDALVQLSAGDTSYGFFIEFDSGHQTAKLIADTKGRAMRVASETGTPLWGLKNPRAIFIAPSAARLRSVARKLASEGAGDLWLGTHIARLEEVGVLGKAFGEIVALAKIAPGEDLPLTQELVPLSEAK